ncbi:acyloxyacyl hydrolase-like [Saccostrea echinata]|uniref:acyloxyacyl hydrolase-like n=1 Tax=Saccostrea echinata TaxID=191078 RepID=UPI002A8267D6|nr:acyloxyacyl hydrolase-like [Saccostrea echinata]
MVVPVAQAMCTVVLGLAEQLSVIHNETVVKGLERICNFLPGSYQGACKEFTDFIAADIIKVFSRDDTADTACHKLSFCFTEPHTEMCHIFPIRPKQRLQLQLFQTHRSHRIGANICDLPGIKRICTWIDDIFSKHDPAVDLDGDFHSVYQTLRGTSWRGKDCDDERKAFHPGAKPINGDKSIDSNCNGIYGVNPANGRGYEEELCGTSQPRGVAVLGDSISAHFHLPREWFNATEMSLKVFEPLPFMLENELDWPEFSSTTAFMNNTEKFHDVIHGPVDSMYMRMFDRNHCNHRDYQNIAVNGARASSMADTIQFSLRRNITDDQPMIVFYALVGNDVCNGHHDTFNHMTTVEEMKNKSISTLNFLTKVLPKESHVFFVGLADGAVLYRALSDRVHPIGSLRNDVTYSNFYDYFNCLEISPCLGWMNTNATIRDLTTKRAIELSEALKEVVVSHQSSFSNFKLYYLDNPIDQVLDEWTKQGGEAWELLEPVDGFHSNQHGQALTAKTVWENLEKMYPDVIGPVNPNNSRIKSLFGNQGGYL